MPAAMRRIPFAWLALLPTLAAAAVAAEERPPIRPTRDVDITYTMTGADDRGQPRTLSERMRWAPAAGLLRVDPPTPDVYFIVQMQQHHLLAVREAARTVMLLEADTAALVPGVGHASHFERGAAATVAGLPCTDWNTQDTGGQPATVCLTEDGVLLRAKQGEQVLVQARTVDYATADPAVFQVPAGFQTVRPPR